MENRFFKRKWYADIYKRMNELPKIELPALTTLSYPDLGSTTESSSVVSEQTPGDQDGIKLFLKYRGA